MLPILFAIGSFSLKTIIVFIGVSLLTAAFVFWRKGREEHYNEFELMDCFLKALVVSIVVGRISYIFHNFPTLGMSPATWFDFFSHPGIHGLSAIVASMISIYKSAIANKWDAFELLDFWAIALAYGLSVIYFGLFLDGTYYGNRTNLPFGVLFPGLVDKHHPLQLYLASFFTAISVFLSRIEYRYRTFEWYRAGKKAAQTGFLISVFIILLSLTMIMTNFLKPRNAFLPYLDLAEYAVFLIVGIVMLLKRSGRTLGRKA